MSLINIGKAAEKLGIPPDTLRNWEKQGRIKSVRTEGNHRRFDEMDIECCRIRGSCSKYPAWDERVAGRLGIKQWYDFVRSNDPELSLFADYAEQRVVDIVDQLRFVIILIVRNHKERIIG